MVDEIKDEERSMVNKIENKSKICNKATRDKMKKLFCELKENRETSQSELKALRVKLMVVSLACIGISLICIPLFEMLMKKS